MEGVSVIMALRRNTAGLDYTPFANRDNKGALGHFWYGGRVIWYHKQEGYGHTVYLYLDEKRRVEEQEDYLAKADDPENDHYTMESYNEHVLKIFRGKAQFLVSGLDGASAAVLGASAVGWEIQ